MKLPAQKGGTHTLFYFIKYESLKAGDCGLFFLTFEQYHMVNTKIGINCHSGINIT